MQLRAEVRAAHGDAQVAEVDVIDLPSGNVQRHACGDVRLSPIKRVASAVAEGSMAIAFVHQYLQQERARTQA